MRKSVLVLAVIAASCSVAAANELKQDRASTVVATQMTDAEMDTVSAGAANFQEKCNANGHCHLVGGGGQSWHRNANNGYIHSNGRGAHFIVVP
jgi:hypothetical protein